MTQDFTDDEPTFLQEAREAMDTLVYPASTWTVLDVQEDGSVQENLEALIADRGQSS